MVPESLARAVLVAAATFTVVLPARSAQACGGCFSPPSATVPQTVAQDAERVLYFHNPKNPLETIVWVEVRYTGLAQDFGWVLPLPKLPKVSVGLTLGLDLLDAHTKARWQLQYDKAGPENCRNAYDGCQVMQKSQYSEGPSLTVDSSAKGPAPQAGANGNNAEAVTVLAQGQTGPYDYAVVSGKSAEPLLKWLNDRGYGTPPQALPILQSHVAKGDVFVAIKLSNGAGVNLIRPVVLTMEDADACVPLRLTSIAAQQDMTVQVTLAGNGRAVPKNHLHVEVNPARIDWFQGGQNFAQLAAAAIDEAGGRAFVTESAQPGAALPNLLGNLEASPAKFKNAKSLYDVALALPQSGLPMTEEVAAVLDDALGLAQLFPGVGAAQALANLHSCGQYFTMPFGPPDCQLPKLTLKKAALQGRFVDGGVLAKVVEEGLVTPLRDLRDGLKAAPMVTRMTLRISPEEMDRDPIFAFNPDLPAVAPTRVAQYRNVCTTGWHPPDALRLTLAGLGSWVMKGAWGVNLSKDARFAQAPTALRVELLDETGGPVGIDAGQIELVDTAIMGALPGKASLPHGMTLKVPTAWLPPVSDAPVLQLSGWKRPYPQCVPKKGWVEGKLPPVGAVPGDPRLPGIEGGGRGADALGQAAAGSDAMATGPGCTAAPGGQAGGMGLAALGGLLLAVVAVWRRRANVALATGR
ncbi:MAG: DUF2330 domain-containing protein [Myxococcales bacterium]|nr:DUF2330 domain-containing protein [Myxococcales bacterium]